MTFRYKAGFERQLKRLPSREQVQVAEAIEQLVALFDTHRTPAGLGVKKLSSGREGALFEARASLAVRVLFMISQDLVTFVMVGDHDEVRRFIRSFK